MISGLGFAAASGFVALLALSAPASAATWNFDLVDTGTTFTPPAHPEYTFYDLGDASNPSGLLPSFSLHSGDSIHLELNLSHSVTVDSFYDFFLNDAVSPDAGFNIAAHPTFSHFLGGVSVPWPDPSFAYTSGTTGYLGTGAGFLLWGTNSITFDKVIIDFVIGSLTDSVGNPLASIEMLPTQASLSVYTFAKPPVAATPIPGSVLLMSTALGSLGLVARRKRKAAA